jgi:hypothetical protein
MIEQPNLTMVRHFVSDRFVLQRADGQGLAVLTDGVPGDASVEGRTVQLAAKRRNRRIAIEAVDGDAVLGWIRLSWVPGRHRIRVGDSEFRVTRAWLWRGWHVSRDGVRLATLQLSPWFSSGVNLVGVSQKDVGNVVLFRQPSLDRDILLALVLLLEIINFQEVSPPLVSTGG